jgi:hypothetical protein
LYATCREGASPPIAPFAPSLDCFVLG